MKIKTAISSLLAATAIASADPVDWSAYAQSFEIAFPGYSGTETLTDFPVLIRLSAERNGFLYNKCRQPNGGDLRFSDADGNLLASEVDTWDPNGESLIWVKVPSLTQDTIITAHYGCVNPAEVNPKSVWSNGYVGVWHLGEDGLAFPDSTINGLDFSCAQNHADYVGRGIDNGAVGKSVEFSVGGSAAGCLLAEDSDLLDGFQTVTFEFWTYQTTHAPGRNITLFKKQGSENTAFRFYQNNDDPRTLVGFYLDGYSEATWWGNAGKGAGTLPLDQWNHQAYTYNWQHSATQSKSYGYLNGSQIASRSSSDGHYTFLSNDGKLCLGNEKANGSNAYAGRMDEFRISNVARSADWVKATYDTVNNADFAIAELPNDWKRYSHTFSVSFPGATNGVLFAFPVLVKISTADIPNFRYSDCLKPNGEDLRFADEEGNLLDSEIDTWNPDGESLIWVNVPSLSTTTAIKAYYGWSFAPVVNPQNVWTNGFVGVWHLGESENPLHVSVSGASDFATFSGSAKAPDTTSGILWAQAGAVGNAVSFKQWGDYTNNCLRAGYRNAYNGMSALTVEAWTYRDSTLKGGYVLDMVQRPGTEQAYCMYDKNNSRKVEFDFWNANGTKTSLTTSGNVPADTWVYQAATYDSESDDANNAILYIDGNVSVSAAGGDTPVKTANSSGHLHLGNAHNYTGYNLPFPGKIDEVRISNVARSAGWLATTYDMIKGNATFATYSNAKENSAGTIVIFH